MRTDERKSATRAKLFNFDHVGAYDDKPSAKRGTHKQTGGDAYPQMGCVNASRKANGIGSIGNAEAQGH